MLRVYSKLMNESNVQSVLNQLEQLKSASPSVANTAEYWIHSIRDKQTFWHKRAHPIVFIGRVGVGKSSLIGVAAHLLVDNKPTDKTSLKKNSVLSIGAGRTTVCEVRIRAPQADETGKLGLLIEPVTEDEMRTEIAIYAETEWYRRQPKAVFKGEDDTEPTPQEIQRVIRNMTDYTEYQKIFTEGEKRRTVRPLDEVIPRFDSYETFLEHLLERANLSGRTETAWWWDACNVENLQALKGLFENINQGRKLTAMLPRRMTVVVPEPLPDSTTGLALTLIDTKGLDSPVESRADLYEYLRHPHAIIVLCAPFKEAPSESLRALLHSLTADAELRPAIPRTLLVLVDQDDAEQVNGADGDREFGQDLKIEECYRALESAGFPGIIGKERIIAFDVLLDERNRLQMAIDNCLAQLRQTAEKEQRELINDAKNFLENAANALRPALCNAVDEQLNKTMAQHLLPSYAPLRHPLEGLYAAIQATRSASVVYASCRRNGAYSQLNLYAAIRANASRAATQWVEQLISPVLNQLKTLKHSFALVQDHISLRERQYQQARLQVIGDYAERLEKQVSENLAHDSVWQKCANEWGQGDGFKNRVLRHLEDWESRQQGITAHETTNAIKVVPRLEEVSQPSQAPQFTLHIRNLRVLRQVNWTPTPLSVVIGANGTGKTTLLLVLKLLRVAYQRNLSEAVIQVLGGSSNLKTWRVSEEEPVEIGLDIDTVSWRIQLVPREGSVDYLTNERLTEQEREIFSRDGLGAFYYGGYRIEPDSKLGLRVLMDRGADEPALRKVASLLQRIAVYHDPDLWGLRWQGSNTSEDRILHTRGINALALLRRWYQERVNYHRYQFVVEGLAAAFPNTVAGLDFVEAGNTLAARIYQPGQEFPSPLATEANGVLQLLVLFCEVASAESVVAIDEPENSLHPYALRAFLRRTSRWIRQHNLTVLLATHSTVILDELSATPELVYVMKAPGGPMPTRLDELCNREWLENFKLGDLYEQGEIGSNEDEAEVMK
jgi:predicted ATPase